MNDVAAAIAATRVHAIALDLLSNVPGFPPLVQTVHLLSIAAIMGSVVLIDLRVLGVALPTQSAAELTRRLLPWTWGALPVLAASGLVFIFAQPHRYFANPVFQIKFALLVPAVALTVVFRRMDRKEGAAAKVVAVLSLCLWIGVALAGRWIAYVDYLWPVE